MAHELKENVVVKWEEYREWRDPGEVQYVWEIRVCVVPKKYAQALAQVGYDPNKSFVVLPAADQGGVEMQIMFPFQTFRYKGSYAED